MRTVTLLILVLVLFIAVSCMAQSEPVSAQGFATPTPLPAVKATLEAANAAQQAAQADLQQADQMDAKAAEMRRNGLAQQAQAQSDLGNARAAVAAQNYEAIGEAVGKAQSDIEQLSKTNAGQADMIATLTSNQKAQAAAVISASNDAARLRVELQQERATNQTITANFTALQNQRQQDERTTAVGNIASAFAFLVAGALLMTPLVVILFRKTRNDAPPDPPIDAPWKVTDEDRAEDDSAKGNDE